MLLDRYPTLQRLHRELTDLAAVEDDAKPPGVKRPRLKEGRDLTRVEWPGTGTYWLTAPQAAVVQILFEAYLHSESAEVDQATLLRAAKVKGVRRLADVFRRSRAFGELVIAGKSPGTYRLAELPEVIVEVGDPEEE